MLKCLIVFNGLGLKDYREASKLGYDENNVFQSHKMGVTE
jgi:hypothetical protein